MLKKTAIFVLIFIPIVAGHIYFEVNFPKLNKVELETEKIPKGNTVKILQISDVHSSRKTDFVIQKLDEENPDIVVLTGDLIDGKSKDIGHIYKFVKRLVGSGKKIFYVKGNHEWRNSYNPDFADEIEKLGVTVLENSKEIIYINGVAVNICGIDDFQTRHSNLEKAVSDIDRSFYTVLLSHSPSVVMYYEDLGADIMLSGHTHGGQVRFPIIGGVIAPGQGFFPKYQKGLYEVGKGTTLYIDSGYGTSTLPLRVLSRSQISLIEINGK